jgi:hypothetical protein
MRSSQEASLANLASRVNSVSATTITLLAVFPSAVLWIPFACDPYSTWLSSQQRLVGSIAFGPAAHNDGPATICTHFNLHAG